MRGLLFFVWAGSVLLKVQEWFWFCLSLISGRRLICGPEPSASHHARYNENFFFSSITFKNSSFYKPSILRFPQFTLPKGHHQRRWSGVGWSGYPVPDLESGDVRGGGAGSERLHPPHRTERHDADPEQKDPEREIQTERIKLGEHLGVRDKYQILHLFIYW